MMLQEMLSHQEMKGTEMYLQWGSHLLKACVRFLALNPHGFPAGILHLLPLSPFPALLFIIISYVYSLNVLFISRLLGGFPIPVGLPLPWRAGHKPHNHPGLIISGPVKKIHRGEPTRRQVLLGPVPALNLGREAPHGTESDSCGQRALTLENISLLTLFVPFTSCTHCPWIAICQ